MILLADLINDATWFTVLVFIADLLIRIGLSVRVVMRRADVGVSLSWLIVILTVPFLGAAIYLVVGENRLGSRRAKGTIELHNAYAGWRSDLRDRSEIDWDTFDPGCAAVHRQAVRVSGVPALPGNRLELLTDSHGVLQAIVRDIDAAQHRCHLEFYIWHAGGETADVADALVRAAQRGVACRVLLDAVGSKRFLRETDGPARLRDAGVEVVESLPAGLLRALFRRIDLRNHRKLVVIDGKLAYTGSLNMIDPDHFKSTSGVGRWVDAMVRLEGPAVEAMAVTFLEDWQLETGQSLEPVGRRDTQKPSPQPPSEDEKTDGAESGPDTRRGSADQQPPADAPVQVVPSGPTLRPENIHRLLIAAIYSARQQITLTTPYFVPDESLLIALTSAAARGVDTLIIMPEKNDSMLVRHASNAYLGELLAAGVKVARYTGGLLHTKSVTIDNRLAAFGTVNLDMRSFHLNFELTLLVYDPDFTRRLTSLQQSYVINSNMAQLDAWRNRPFGTRLLDNAARLLGPLL